MKIWQKITASPWAFCALLALAVLLHLGSSVAGHFYADDYLQRSMVQGSSALAEKGLLDGVKPQNFVWFVSNQFNFFSPDNANYQAMREYGVLPWWAGDDIALHFFRPLASATHFIDYTFWPDKPRLMHVEDLLWYVLALSMMYLLYRALQLPKSVVLLALLLIILDASMFQVLTWIASRSMLMVLSFGFFAVYAYHKSLHSKVWYALALAALLLALLSAEAALGICAYLGAYLFTLDNRPWLKRFLHILPFAVLTLLWHSAYQKAGFGAFATDFYLDPAQEPRIFLVEALHRLPSNFFQLASGLDLFSAQVRPDWRQFAGALAGLLSMAYLLYLLWPVLKQDKRLQFFFLASVLALVPGLTIALAPRVMVLPNVGMAVVLASIVVLTANKAFYGLRAMLANGAIFYIVLVHIGLSLLLALQINVSAIQAKNDAQPHGYVAMGVTDYADKYLVAINSNQPFWWVFLAHQLDYQRQALPKAQRLLASNFTTLTLTRISEQVLQLDGLPALQFDRQPLAPLNTLPEGHFIYLSWEIMGIFRAARTAWQEECRDFTEMQICVTQLYQGKPQQLLITLHKPLSEYRFISAVDNGKTFQTFELPAVGESRTFQGIF